jgi:hypothetical protein
MGGLWQSRWVVALFGLPFTVRGAVTAGARDWFLLLEGAGTLTHAAHHTSTHAHQAPAAAAAVAGTRRRQ